MLGVLLLLSGLLIFTFVCKQLLILNRNNRWLCYNLRQLKHVLAYGIMIQARLEGANLTH